MSEAFNKSELLAEIDNDMEFLAELYEMLQSDAPALIDSINDGLDSNNVETIWKNAHALKSMVGNFAAHNAQDLAYKIELLGREEKLDDVRQNLPLLKSEIERLVSTLGDLLRQA
jgi:two-component system, sensor histidine kinase and response regulator